MKQFEGKVVLVTGGSSGIGRAAALAFAEAGAKLVIADVNAAGGEATSEMIRKASGEALFVRTDVTKAADTEAMVNKAVEVYGRLDCAFNNAGVLRGGRITEFSEEDWDAVISINLKGVWLCMKYEIPQMLKLGRGAIVNTASIAGLVGAPGASGYVASKHGVVGMTKAAALEYAKQGIRINAVCPGWIHTPMTEGAINDPESNARIIGQDEPIGRVGDPREVAEAVVWLCSDAASFVTGHAMAVDGGYVAQ